MLFVCELGKEMSESVGRASGFCFRCFAFWGLVSFKYILQMPLSPVVGPGHCPLPCYGLGLSIGLGFLFYRVFG